MGPGVFEAVTGVRVAFAAAFIRANVGFFSWGKKKGVNDLKKTNKARESSTWCDKCLKTLRYDQNL